MKELAEKYSITVVLRKFQLAALRSESQFNSQYIYVKRHNKTFSKFNVPN